MKKKLINFLKNIIFFFGSAYYRTIYIICCLFPINNKKVFGNHFDGKPYGDSPKYIIEELKKIDSSFIFIWNLKTKKKTDENKLIYVKRYSLQYFYHLATSKIWLSSVRMPYFVFRRKNQIYYHTWHGALGIKKVENECAEALSPRYIRTAKHDSKMINYFISDNKDQTELFKNQFWAKNPTILEFGCPRNDVVFYHKNILKNEFNIVNKKVLLYAPTFRIKDSFKKYDIDFNRLLSCLKAKTGDEWVIMIRLHPRLSNQSDKFINYSDTIIDGTKIFDIQECLNEFDGIITDYSSIIFDFMRTGKPAFIYASDIDEYKNDRSFHFNLYDLPFSISTNNEELISNILSYSAIEYSKKVNLFEEKIGFYSNGNASRKCAEHIIKQI